MQDNPLDDLHRKELCLFFIGLGWLLTLTACTIHVKRIDEEAACYGFTRKLVPGADFMHVVYLKDLRPSTSLLHVYIEGDGAPWLRLHEVAEDPTPRHPLMLKLMALDPAPSVYLGRPCYLGLARVPPCTPRFWTHERYSKEVVLSLATALRRLVRDQAATDLVLIGHSGGGSLAMLLAEYFETTRAVITLAGNLDVNAWAAWHGYTPLRGSLNPASRLGLNRNIIQRHYVGLRDEQVPPNVIKRFAASHPDAELFELKAMGHQCCWEKVWPNIIGDLEKALKKARLESSATRAHLRRVH